MNKYKQNLNMTELYMINWSANLKGPHSPPKASCNSPLLPEHLQMCIF